jgi:hypothetical protein
MPLDEPVDETHERQLERIPPRKAHMKTDHRLSTELAVNLNTLPITDGTLSNRCESLYSHQVILGIEAQW